jgi:hypothetical protein
MNKTLLQKSIELNEKLVEALVGIHEPLIVELIEIKKEAAKSLSDNSDNISKNPMMPNESFDLPVESQTEPTFTEKPQMPTPPEYNNSNSQNLNDLI